MSKTVPLSVMSKGNITLNNIRAEQNVTGYETILLDNCQEDSITNLCQGSGSVSMLNSLGPNIIMNNNGIQRQLEYLQPRRRHAEWSGG